MFYLLQLTSLSMKSLGSEGKCYSSKGLDLTKVQKVNMLLTHAAAEQAVAIHLISSVSADIGCRDRLRSVAQTRTQTVETPVALLLGWSDQA